MIALPPYSGETALFGLGRSGLAALAALQAAGNKVVAWDDDAASRQAAEDMGAALRDLTTDFGAAERLIVSPGVPLTHPQPHAAVAAARAAGAEIIGDMDLFADALQAAGLRDSVTLIGITGTNGKSTTTALVAHMLTEAGHAVHIGGNIGTPVLDLPIEKDAVYVLELSSYQLDLNRRFGVDIGVWLNITPDHLDRHGDIAGYVAAKANLFADGKSATARIICIDDAPSLALAEGLLAEGLKNDASLVRIGQMATADISYSDAYVRTGDTEIDLSNCAALRGAHNGQNAAAAFAVGQVMGLSAAAMQAALADFAGMPHRLQMIGAHHGIAFVNDSKATNAEATRHALAAFDNIYWIAGGRAKADAAGRLGLDILTPHIGNIRAAFLIGEAASKIADELPSGVAVSLSQTLDRAVTDAAGQAMRDALDAPVVLLSPACASFDQFVDFEARGAAFGAAVSDWATRQEGAQ